MKTTQIDILSPCNRLIGVQIVPLENLSGVVQGMQDRALPGTVGTEQQRDGAKVEGTGSRMPLKFSDSTGIYVFDFRTTNCTNDTNFCGCSFVKFV